ncbi:MAG: acylneuraminate cytidylyltransferase family protein [Bacteroidia bacterium]|nr:acylneuraminate cytidylyltransferase family protein [Bacteroidia bacterium]
MKYIAIIPARGGSKRLPGKNIKLFCGKPLIYYSIIAAAKSIGISNVFVSTDDEKIATVAKEYGANIIMRPVELASDTSTTTSALQHVLSKMQPGDYPNAVITLQPTNPLRKISLIESAIRIFEQQKENVDSVITVSENKCKLGKIENGLFEPVSYSLEQRSQDISKLYFENGLIYITKSEVIQKKESVFGEKIYPFITEDLFGDVDIDTLQDFELGELIFNKYKNEFNF